MDTMKTRLEEISDQLGSLRELVEKQGRSDNEKAWQQLEAFDGGEDEYLDWSQRFQAVLEDAGLPNILTLSPDDVPFDSGKKEAFEFVNKRIALKLRVKTKGVAFGIVNSYPNNGLEAWAALRDHFEPRTTTRRLALRSQFDRIVMGATEDPAQYFQRLDRHRERLVYLGEPMPETTMISHVLLNLPHNYQELRPILERLSYNYDQVKHDLRSHYLSHVQGKKVKPRLATSGADGQEKALVAFGGSCDFCGQSGHKWRRCPQRAANRGEAAGGGSNGSAGTGGGGGGCGTGGIGRGGRGGGRGGQGWRKLKCAKCGKIGHKTVNCRSPHQANAATEEDSEEENVVLIAMEHLPPVALSTNDPDSRPERWVVDSACSTHMAEEFHNFHNIRRRRGIVKMGASKEAESIGLGDLHLWTTTSKGKRIKVTLTNVLIVPNLGFNLLSVPRIYDTGGSATFAPVSSFLSVGGVKIPIRRAGQVFEVDLFPGSTRTQRRGLGGDSGNSDPPSGGSGRSHGGGARGGGSAGTGGTSGGMNGTEVPTALTTARRALTAPRDQVVAPTLLEEGRQGALLVGLVAEPLAASLPLLLSAPRGIAASAIATTAMCVSLAAMRWGCPRICQTLGLAGYVSWGSINSGLPPRQLSIGQQPPSRSSIPISWRSRRSLWAGRATPSYSPTS